MYMIITLPSGIDYIEWIRTTSFVVSLRLYFIRYDRYPPIEKEMFVVINISEIFKI